MNELALFAGGGGGIYGSLLLGHTPVCAVEIMPRRVRIGKWDGSVGLARLVQMWPTPCSTDSKGAGKSGQLRDLLGYAVQRGATKSQAYESPQQAGQLNPMWEDWLMGWPIGHTGLEPLGTGKLAEWQQSHSLCLERG